MWCEFSSDVRDTVSSGAFVLFCSYGAHQECSQDDDISDISWYHDLHQWYHWISMSKSPASAEVWTCPSWTRVDSRDMRTLKLTPASWPRRWSSTSQTMVASWWNGPRNRFYVFSLVFWCVLVSETPGKNEDGEFDSRWNYRTCMNVVNKIVLFIWYHWNFGNYVSVSLCIYSFSSINF